MADQRICPGCGRGITPGPRERNPRRWCSEQCRRWANRHPETLRSLSRTCPTCDANMSERSTRAKYCTKRCGEIARGKRLPRQLALRQCALPECSQEFQPSRKGQRCCCEKHGKVLYNRESRADGRQKAPPWNDKRRDRYHRRRAQKKAASTGEPVLLADIAERDRWRCHICGTRVGKKIAWPHPRSASLDHIVPLSQHGPHDPANVQLAHLGCNSARNNRGGGEQLLLVG